MQVKKNSQDNPHVILRPARSTWVVFLVIWGWLVLLGTLVAIKNGNFLFPVLWIGLAGGIASCVLLSSVSLQCSSEEIIYRSLFRTLTIRFGDVEGAEISSRARGPFSPPLLLVIKPKIHVALPPIKINLKLFSPGALRALRETLAANGVVVQ